MARMKRGKRLPDLSAVGDIGSILIVRLKALGDIALSMPVVRALRARYPKAHIVYLCREGYTEVLADEASIDEVIGLREGFRGQLSVMHKLMRSEFDLALDLIGLPRSAMLTLLSGARIRIGMDVGRHGWCYHYLLPRVIMIGGKRVKCYTMDANREIVRMLNLWSEDKGISDETEYGSPGGARHRYAIGFSAAESEREWAEVFLDRIGVDREKLIGCVPAATYQSKSWPSENFVELLKILRERFGLVTVILWGPGEEERASSIAQSVPGSVLAPPAGIAKLGALISGLRLLVTLDSGPKHLAVMQGIPTVTLFGPTDPVIWDPADDNHRALYLGLPCSPCRKRECRPNSCLTGIQPEEVALQIADLLDSRLSYCDHAED
jgi:heptosyltransferase-1